MKQEVPKPISGGLILSYRCSCECLHCMYACSPRWEADWISENDLEMVLSKLSGRIAASPYGPNNVSLNSGLHFTGGEPFLNFELLLNAVIITEEYAIPSTFVETNCFWCTSDRDTREKLSTLKSKGLKGILVSVNPFYLEWVPFERTKRAVQIGYELFGNNMFVYQLDYFRRFVSMGIEGRVSFYRYLEQNNGDFLHDVEFFFMGRAAYDLGERLAKVVQHYEPQSLFGRQCVGGFLRPWHNHFDNYCNYVPGYCGGISFGDCRDLDNLLTEGLDLDDYPVLAYLVSEDIKGLFEFAQDLGYMESGKGYLSKCHLCVDIRRFLVTAGEFRELRPKEFYQQLK
ncbi:MAG: hypothetical protein JSV25_12445 [Spirochaetota bacterium]|nr:MAG: hypothetical protein JSV25_12445 [Spirochaetota bacterium]